MPSSKTPDLDIVIVNWNAGALLDRCLESIAASEGREQFLSRIILVDNASSDGSTEGLERHGLPLHLLKQTKNLGYGRAADLGARTAEATFLLFLNPDIRLKGDSLRRSLERLTALEESLARPPAILGVALLDEDGTVSRSCARFPSAGQQFAESLGLTRLLPEAFKPTIMTDWDHGFSREVDHVMGAFALMRRQHYLDLGGFDPDYFVYWEDLDLSLRAAKAGFASFYAQDIKATHRGGGTTDQLGDGRRLALALQARRTYAKKNFSAAGRLLAMTGLWLVEPLTRLVWGLAKASPARIADTLKGYSLMIAGADPTKGVLGRERRND